MTAVFLSFGAFLSTLCGGVFALRFQRHLAVIIAFASGVLLGVVAFDILPELFNLAHGAGVDASIGMMSLAAGIFLFNSLHHWLGKHLDVASPTTVEPRIGVFSGIAMSGHSLMDGLSIGLGFQVSPTVGTLVALAVITHDFCDGLNTVSVMLIHGNSSSKAKLMLGLDAVAPVIGALMARLFVIPVRFMVIYLGLFGGFLFFIAITTTNHPMVVAARRKDPLKILALSLVGCLTVFLLVRAGA